MSANANHWIAGLWLRVATLFGFAACLERAKEETALALAWENSKLIDPLPMPAFHCASWGAQSRRCR